MGAQLNTAESPALLEPHRIKPEFRDVVVTLNVNMWGFVTVTRIEEEPIRP